MKKMGFAVISLAVFLLMTGTLYAQPPREKGRPYAGPKDRIIQELNLSPEQQSRLEENRKAQRQEMKRLHDAVKEKNTKLREALKNPGVTREGVQPLTNELKSLQAQLIDSRINGILAVKEILTPEQFSRFNEMMEKRSRPRKTRFLKWCEKRFGRGGGEDHDLE
ncbi:MAG: hypothetical protein AMJ95_08680 [Omnitrophica WOR_2 bacterium SM23_72]|nr:MAG: hypothetical protein AMJ95_08680 [Omnitrophica WOR_2 bacterium SM23_72]